MRYKLDKSLNITFPYLAAQVRVLHGRIAERGVECDRIYLALADYPNGPNVHVLAAGCSDVGPAEAFVASLRHFKGSPFDHGHIRSVVIENIATLHERINT
jgi:hypothetical protein